MGKWREKLSKVEDPRRKGTKFTFTEGEQRHGVKCVSVRPLWRWLG